MKQVQVTLSVEDEAELERIASTCQTDLESLVGRAVELWLSRRRWLAEEVAAARDDVRAGRMTDHEGAFDEFNLADARPLDRPG